jgi:hypothetical protein
MHLITTGEAQKLVVSLKDRLGRPIDPGIAESLTEFIRVTQALGFKTIGSCEGHIDWGLPYPWIDFEVSAERVPVPSLWKLWKFSKRRRAIKESKKHAQNAEEKTDQLCAMLTRFLVQHDKVHGVQPEAFLVIDRWQRFLFRLMPARTLLSDSYKVSGDISALNSLLEEHRGVFKSFASFCARTLEQEQNLVGTPDEGCKGCMGRG